MMGSHHRSKTGGGLFGRCNAIEKEMRRHSVSDAKPAMQEGCLEKLRVHVLTAGQGDRNNFVPGRKSLPHIETNAADVAAVLRVKVMAADMPPFMQLHAFRCARRAYDTLDKFSSRQMAHDLKKEFDKAYGATWHCIVGTSFGSFVTHSNGCFLYFSMDKILVLLYKTKIRRA